MAAGKHLWFRMYVSVHLGAEKWKKTHFVAFSEEVFLTIGHVHSLVLNHVSADHQANETYSHPLHVKLCLHCVLCHAVTFFQSLLNICIKMLG